MANNTGYLPPIEYTPDYARQFSKIDFHGGGSNTLIIDYNNKKVAKLQVRPGGEWVELWMENGTRRQEPMSEYSQCVHKFVSHIIKRYALKPASIIVSGDSYARIEYKRTNKIEDIQLLNNKNKKPNIVYKGIVTLEESNSQRVLADNEVDDYFNPFVYAKPVDKTPPESIEVDFVTRAI